ncbi:alpha-methylacyl-CoA racemase [Paraburkholderia sp. BL10I2N1]|nr:alpha-methylacyl-CoA racemase [Paraburkholderia sp. BL10I2N1]
MYYWRNRIFKELQHMNNALPLDGVSVVELAAIGPVPFTGRMLHQLGAEVTVVCAPRHRDLGIPMSDDPLESGKHRVVIDLKTAAGRDALGTLVRESDVLIEGFRPGTLERLELAPAYLHSVQPALVIGRCAGWAATGARASSAGHDINFLALAGILGAIGPKECPSPPINLLGDFGGGGMHLALGVVAALLQAKRDGKGAVVQTSIFGASVSLTAHLHGMLDSGLWIDDRQSNLLDGGAPFYRCYRTSDDHWLAIGAIEPKFFAELVSELDVEVDAARQYDRSYWPTLTQILSQRIAARTRDEWDTVFAQGDACATPVLTWKEARSHRDGAVAFEHNAPKPAITFHRE